jgi:16S rRNA processing protein RimM
VPAVVSATPPAEAIVVMGRVAAPYGVHGWLRIQVFSGEAGALLRYGRWWLKPNGAAAWREVTRTGEKVHSGAVLALFEGVPTREAAMLLRGAEIGVARSELPPLGPDEVYWADLVGLDVVNREGVTLGRVAGVAEFGAHPLLRVTPGGEEAAPAKAPDERLIPFVAAHVDRVDLAARRIEVDWQPDY